MMDDVEPRLRDLLETARADLPWWAVRVPASFDSALAALRSIAPLTRAELQRERVRLTSATGDASSWRRSRSSGTTGEPVEVILDAAAIAAEEAAFSNHLDRLLSRDWRRRPVIHAALHPEATSVAWQAGWGGVALKWNLSRLWQAAEEVRRRGLSVLDGAIVTGLPTVVAVLAEAAEPLPRPMAIVLSGESVEPHAAVIARRFETVVASQYVLSEAGIAGVGCSTADGYHVATENVLVEIEAGEILITPLANRAMILLRYRTGDEGAWLAEPCGCGDPRPRFRVLSRRSGDASPSSVIALRLAKFFAELEVASFDVDAPPGGALHVRYRPSRALGDWQRRLIARTIVQVVPGDAEAILEEQHATGRRTETVIAPSSLTSRLAALLTPRQDVRSAVIGGSAADPAARHRGSDVDLIVLVHDREDVGAWIAISRALAAEIPGLSVHADVAEELAASAPLLAARLLDAHIHVTGAPLERVLRRPTVAELRVAARFFCHDARARLWELLTAPEPPRADPIVESVRISRLAIDALRYHRLLHGGHETRVDALLASLRAEGNLPAELIEDLTAIVDVGREYRPPPLANGDNLRGWLVAAWVCVEIAERSTRLGNEHGTG